jgi:predicted acylesterase/phospholipase RssA
MPDPPSSIIFQAGKLGHLEAIFQELEWARAHLADQEQIDRIYGISGGTLVALAFALALSSERQRHQYKNCEGAILEISNFISNARRRDIRRLNLNPWYGIFNLNPLRGWITRYLQSCGLEPDLTISALPVELYLCAGDQDGFFSLFGPPNPELQFAYTWVQVGPPQDAPLVDALIAALSTSLSTEPGRVLGSLYRDCRPAINDASAIIADLEATSPRSIVVQPPHTPPPPWRLNWITSSFIMHRHHERNQALLARYYTDLLERHQALVISTEAFEPNAPTPHLLVPKTPQLTHIDLPYIGSTEAFTNMRQSVAEKKDLMSHFKKLLAGQFDHFDFGQPTNVIYGAGGFSGILAGLVTTRQVEAGFTEGGGRILHIYGVSAGVLNGFFHAIQVAAQIQPDLYTTAAENALNDLERFFENVNPGKIANINLNPQRFWQGWANLNPLEQFIRERLRAYTGSTVPEELTFDDIHLPLTVAVARNDGLTDFLGMTRPERRMQFAGSEIRVRSAKIIRSVIAGWSMNTYISPTSIGDQAYRDGGGSFYDPALFVACMDDHLQNLLNIHLDEPEGHSYNLPDRPSLLRLIFDTHNYNFPEERRRMRLITDLLYRHFALRAAAVRSGYSVPNDFRQEWTLPSVEKIMTDRYFSNDKELG